MKLSLLRRVKKLRFTDGDSSDRTRVVLSGKPLPTFCNRPMYEGNRKRDSLTVLFGRHQSESVHRERYGDHTTYLNWLLNDSPWAPVFKTKKLKEVERFGAEVDVEADLYIVHSAATTFRCGIEKPMVPSVFDGLVKEGIEPHLALMASHEVSGNVDNVSVAGFCSHAAPFDIPTTALSSFRKGFQKLKGQTFKDAPTGDRGYPYDGVDATFKKEGERGMDFIDVAKRALDNARASVREETKRSNKKPTIAYKNPFGNSPNLNVDIKAPLDLFSKHYAIELKKAFPNE